MSLRGTGVAGIATQRKPAPVGYGRERTYAVATSANATSSTSATAEPLITPNVIAMASVAISEPPCERRQLRRAKRYSARVRYCSGSGRVLTGSGYRREPAVCLC